MWPVSTVEGVISACTSRLPGQQVTLRFERPEANLGAVDNMMQPMQATTTLQERQQQTVAVVEDKRQLLKRCREVLRRYANDDQIVSNSKQRTAKFVEKFAVPAMVADKVMEALHKASASVDSVTLSMIMDSYLSCGKPNDAIRAFEVALGFNGNGSFLKPASLTAMEESSSSRIQPNPASLNSYVISCLLKAHAMKRDLKSVRRVVAAMEGKGGEKVSGIETASWPGTGPLGSVTPDTQCYNVAISAATKSGTHDGLQLALKLFDSLNDPSVVFKGQDNGKPQKDVVTYNSMIGSLSLAGRFDDAFNIFFNMKRSGLKPDKFTYTSLLKACVHEGDLQELLYDMKEQGIKEDVAMYNTRIRTLCDEGKLAEARTVITQMESKGVSPDAKTYGILMQGLLDARKPGACLALFENACSNERTSPIMENVVLYTTAVTAASVLGDHNKALDLVSRMSSVGIKPNTKTLTSLVGACLASDRPDLASEVYKRIDAPDGYAMSQGIEAFCRARDLRSAAKVLSSQRRGSRELSGKELMKGYETVVTTALALGDFGMARTMFTELLAKSFIPSKSMFRAMISAMGLLEKGQLALEPIERDPEQFQFLLFLIDSIRQRKIAIDSLLYSAAISCGYQLGGPSSEVALLLVQAKSAACEKSAKEINVDDVSVEPLAVQWEELPNDSATLLVKELKSNSALLPPLDVLVNNKSTRAVFFAEKFLENSKQGKVENPKQAKETRARR